MRFRLPIFFVLVVGLAFLASACSSSDATATTATTESHPQAASALNSTNENRKIGGEVSNHASEFGGIYAWINVGPPKMKELRGQVVLIDFWTYT